MNITKVIIPAAGLGTRFLPYTKTIPKEMLPLGNKPAIQHIIEEGIQSHLKDFFIIISKEKKELRHYFEPNTALEATLESQGKLGLLDSIKTINQNSSLYYIEQPKPLGLGHAIMMAHEQIGSEYFGIMLPDDIMLSQDPGIGQLMNIARKEKASVIAVQEVPHHAVSSYGIVAIKEQINADIFEVKSMVEKPHPDDAPSTLAVIGRYVLSPTIFTSLQTLAQNHTRGELQLTDAIAHMMRNHNEKVYAYKIKGTRHDIGNPKGWIAAINDIATRESVI
ncbi:MAG: UTP--glucose-1-phosphate uridylyltransferase [Candidatus Dependentiae bacterium]|nr:UTP--glucose-1-phosphate uridylyltransferase [Candidatus Dependentiae bacterium]